MKPIRRIIRLPHFIIKIITPFFYGWVGNYRSWEEAMKKSNGYESDVILQKVKDAMQKVKDGTAIYERDSVLFDKIQHSFPLMAALMFVAAKNKGKINVLDFGGSLGSSYFQNLQLLQRLEDFHWCIVEQPHFVEEGLRSFANEHLHFFHNMKECFKEYTIHLVVFSSVLQYLKVPYKILEEVFDHNIEYIIIDRTPFIGKGNDRITVQKVPKWIYKARYPCWFFNKSKFLDFISSSYEIILEFDAIDKANIASEFKGFLLKKT